MNLVRSASLKGATPRVIAGVVAVSLGIGLAISRVSDLDSLAFVLIGLAAFASVMLFPGVFLFLVCVIGNGAFGVVDLTVDTRFGLIALDALLLCVSSALVIRSVVMGDILRVRAKTADPRFRFALGMLGMIALWYLITLAKFEQEPGMTLKAARSTLFYVFGFWGLIVTLSERDVRNSIRGLALGGLLVSGVVIVGSVVDLGPFLPGIPRVSSYLLPEASYFRTVPWGYEFVYLAFFLFMFCDGSFSRWYRIAGLLATALGVIALAFRAYWFGILVALILLYLTPRIRSRYSSGMLRKVLGVAIVVVILLGVTGAVQIVLRRVRLIQEDLSTGHGSVAIRIEQVKALMPLVWDDPILGVGFLHGDGPYASRITPLKALMINRFGTSDVGWLDILIRFGVVGSAAIIVLYVKLYRSLAQVEPPGRGGLATAIRAMILMGLFALPGAALFSIPNGILSVVLPCGILIGATRPTERDRSLAAATLGSDQRLLASAYSKRDGPENQGQECV
jgi:hypothetical protein